MGDATLSEARAIFLSHIIQQLREHPDWIADTVLAISSGARAGQETMQQRVSDKDAAMLAALSLADAKRLDAAAKASLNIVLRRGLAPYENASLVERRFHDAATAEREASPTDTTENEDG